jgi:hypothetical protein
VHLLGLGSDVARRFVEERQYVGSEERRERTLLVALGWRHET